MDKKRFQEIISSFQTRKILVVGDVMLDSYLWGSASRISPEAPVPVVDIDKRSHNPGGAGNVALNVRSLGAAVAIASIIGEDQAGDHLLEKFEACSILSDFILRDSAKPTTVKSRIIAQGQQVVRVDEESRQEFSSRIYRQFTEKVRQHIGQFDALILEDYNKGLLVPALIQDLIQISRDHSVPVYVDPKKENFAYYRNVRLFKPNFPEFLHCTKTYADPNAIEKNMHTLRDKLQTEILMVTRGKDGIALSTDQGIFTVPTRARQVHDVSGAGDSVIGTFVLADLAGASAMEACQLANYAAGKVCEEVGVVPITIEKLSEIIDYHNQA